MRLGTTYTTIVTSLRASVAFPTVGRLGFSLRRRVLQFEVGDKVIYPNHGLGVVVRIEEKTILGTTCGFYALRMSSSETTVFVPTDNVEDVGLRRAIGDHEVKKLFTLLGNGKIENHQNWKGRFKDNSDKMRTGSLYDVVDVLKNLNHLSQSKNLSFREKRMLDRSKFLVVTEISEVMNVSSEQIEQRVEKALERCLVNRVRQITKEKAAKAKSAKARSAKAKAEKAKATATKTAKVKTTKVAAAKAKTAKAKIAKPKTTKSKATKSRTAKARTAKAS